MCTFDDWGTQLSVVWRLSVVCMCTIECGGVDAYVASVELASRWGGATGPREAISHIRSYLSHHVTRSYVSHQYTRSYLSHHVTMEVGSRASAASKGLGGKCRQRRAPWCGASEANGHNSCSCLVLQWVAVCCSVLQCVAVCCNELFVTSHWVMSG